MNRLKKETQNSLYRTQETSNSCIKAQKSVEKRLFQTEKVWKTLIPEFFFVKTMHLNTSYYICSDFKILKKCRRKK